MPKYEVVVHETEAFRIAVSAKDKLEAAKIALEIRGEGFRSHDGYEVEVKEVQDLPDDAEVENDN